MSSTHVDLFFDRAATVSAIVSADAPQRRLDADRWRRDFRILRQRQLRVGNRADHGDEQRYDAREDRPFDKEGGDVHRAADAVETARQVIAVRGVPSGGPRGGMRPGLATTFSPGGRAEGR